MSFIAELKRRNVVRIGIAYAVIGWLLAQVAEFAFETFGAPDWALKSFVVVLLLGLPFALFFAWAFEITPDGVQRDRNANRGRSVPANKRRTLDLVIMGTMAIAIGYFALDKFVLSARVTVEDGVVIAPAQPNRNSIAVLPFDNMSGDPAQQYFSDGMTEEIIGKLASVDGLRVISRTTVEHHKSAGMDIPDIARELNVGFVLEGSVRKSANRVRITAQLIQTSDDSHLWVRNFDADLDDIFTVQETVARQIVDSLGVHLTDSDVRALAQRPTNNVSAYDAYLQGQALVERWNFQEMLAASRTYFNHALTLDPNFANALAGLASVEAQTFRNFDADPARLRRADELLDRALAIQPELVRAVIARGELLAGRYRYTAASEQFRRAVEVEPENYFAWDLLCWSLAYETPPRGEEAESACRNGLRIAPQYGEFYYHLARALAVQGKFDDARKAISDMRRIWPNDDLPKLGLFWIYIEEKNYAEAMSLLTGQTETPLILAAMAATYSGMGNPETAVEILDKALARGFRDVAWLAASEHFAAVRALPAYRDLLSRYELEAGQAAR